MRWLVEYPWKLSLRWKQLSKCTKTSRNSILSILMGDSQDSPRIRSYFKDNCAIQLKIPHRMSQWESFESYKLLHTERTFCAFSNLWTILSLQRSRRCSCRKIIQAGLYQREHWNNPTAYGDIGWRQFYRNLFWRVGDTRSEDWLASESALDLRYRYSIEALLLLRGIVHFYSSSATTL